MAPARRAEREQEAVCFSFDHPQVTETTAWNIFRVPTGKTFRVDRVDYLNVTGLAEDTTNVFALALNLDATEAASWSTDSDLMVADAGIPADEFMELTLATDVADLVCVADSVVSLVATEGGAATLPAGRVIVHGRYV
jgi:hypothetical protein